MVAYYYWDFKEGLIWGEKLAPSNGHNKVEMCLFKQNRKTDNAHTHTVLWCYWADSLGAYWVEVNHTLIEPLRWWELRRKCGQRCWRRWWASLLAPASSEQTRQQWQLLWNWKSKVYDIRTHVFRWQDNEDWEMKHCKKWTLPHQWYGTLQIMLKWWGHIKGTEDEQREAEGRDGWGALHMD